jgi:zinc D-Ala-D-Ala carboxypeptidase
VEIEQDHVSVNSETVLKPYTFLAGGNILRNTNSNSKEQSPRSIEDIPIAQRDRFTPDITTLSNLRRQRKTLTRGLYFSLGLAFASIALVIGTFLFREPTTITSSAIAPPVTADQTADTLLGHLRYREATAKDLQLIDGELKLRATALPRFQSMTADAKATGVNLTTISAFQSVSDQERIFFEVQRKQVPEKSSEVGAPPSYNEHHTGYAVDLGDASNTATNLKTEFDTTTAFKWLKANAARYNFEMSFPKGNLQGVSYEPWHWRYVGDNDSVETFYRARKTKTITQPQS